MIATKSPIASSTRAGLTSCSMTRGSCATTMNALRGQSAPQLTHGAGVGYVSTSSAVGKKSSATSSTAAAASARSTRCARRPDGKARIR